MSQPIKSYNLNKTTKDFCFACLCNDDDGVSLSEHKHVVCKYLFFRTIKCKFSMCAECKTVYTQKYGDNFCPWCPSTLKAIEHFPTHAEVQIDDFEELPINFYGDSGFICDVIGEHPIIKRINPHSLMVFQGMTKPQLIVYFFFSIWFAYTVMLPAFIVLFFCFLVGIKNKFFCKFAPVTITLYLNYLLSFLILRVAECLTTSVGNITKFFIFGTHLLCH